MEVLPLLLLIEGLTKDVLEKVTLIKNININNPHRAHIEILFDLNLDELKRKNPITSFVELHNAWQKTLDVSELNIKFYKELANWYYWAVDNVEFPADVEKNKDIRNATSVIRMITRIIFIWFIKEEGLVSNILFNKDKLKNILKDFDLPSDSNKTIYYKTILQNLFFATLNREMDKRDFRKDNQNFGITTLYRYKKYFKVDKEQILSIFKGIPFLNGGLFECLDKPHPTEKGPKGGYKMVRVDGFSDRDDNLLKVPDFLFFSDEKDIDLNKVYGTKNKKYKVRGLIDLLNNYKFTIEENTPIEEEIALDPELLGKVFENLLAAYNPETKATARKQTGSFYTPREIVNYMADESLKASLSNLCAKKLETTTEEDIKAGLDLLFTYTEEESPFDKKETSALVEAISELKILDPACGSGAFPMGILHKLVFILRKLDPENIKWKELQKLKAINETEEAYNIDNENERKQRFWEIEETFTSNASDYGRKLYLIENCLYGVDIQPIAIQIAKLRFFISLIVDQKVDKTKADSNFGIRPLPNLETKFVTANTLIGIEKSGNVSLFDNPEIVKLESELKQIRHKHFNARTPKTKKKYRDDDKETRNKIAELLKENYDKETAPQLANWDPYDCIYSASFFDPEWMFGVNSFDVVIANPPYIQLQKFKGNLLQKAYKKQNYQTFDSMGDIYCLFYEKGINLLKKDGFLCYISSNKWMRAGYGKLLRKHFSEKNSLKLLDFGGFKVFENATVDTNILLIQNAENNNVLQGCPFKNDYKKGDDIVEYFKKNKTDLKNLSDAPWTIGSQKDLALKEKIERTGTPLKDWDVKIYRGVLTGFNEAFIIDEKTRTNILNHCKTKEERKRTEKIIKPILRGRDIGRYYYKWKGLWVIVIPAGWTKDVASEKKLNEKSIHEIFENNYSSISNHLKNIGDAYEKGKIKTKGKGLYNRDDQGDYWWELRHCAYYEEFEKEKIVWQEIVREPSFSYDMDNFYCEATTFLMTGEKLKYLIAVLNSTPSAYFFKTFYAGGGLGSKGYRYKKAFLATFYLHC